MTLHLTDAETRMVREALQEAFDLAPVGAGEEARYSKALAMLDAKAGEVSSGSCIGCTEQDGEGYPAGPHTCGTGKPSQVEGM